MITTCYESSPDVRNFENHNYRFKETTLITDRGLAPKQSSSHHLLNVSLVFVSVKRV